VTDAIDLVAVESVGEPEWDDEMQKQQIKNDKTADNFKAGPNDRRNTSKPVQIQANGRTGAPVPRHMPRAKQAMLPGCVDFGRWNTGRARHHASRRDGNMGCAVCAGCFFS